MNRGKTLDSIRSKIETEFQNSGFSHCTKQSNSDLCFENEFAVYFVFVLDTASELRKDWKDLHVRLIEHYQEHEGPEDREWNYYAIYVVLGKSGTTSGFLDLKRLIEADTNYSRKFVLTTDEIDIMPPGKLSDEDLKAKSDEIPDPREHWEKILGRELIEAICEGPKNKIEDRIRKVIEDGI